MAAPDPVPPSGRLAALVRTRPRAWPLSALVLGALALALLPLGMLAVVAAARNYDALQQTEQRLARARLEAARETARARLGDGVRELRDLALRGVDRARCPEELAAALASAPRLRSAARFDAAGAVICSAGDAAPPALDAVRSSLARAPLAAGGVSVVARLERPTRDLLLVLRDHGVRGAGDAVAGRVPRAELAGLIDGRLLDPGDRLTLTVGGTEVARWGGGAPAAGAAAVRAPVLAGMTFELATARAGLTAAQVLGVTLPVLMWLTALAIVWFAIDRIAVKPLTRMRGVLERYGGGDRAARLTPLMLRGRELSDLAESFDGMADRLDLYAADMDRALATQRALTREVHHRVKNNLQIVSSLLSLQARGVANAEVAEAYALIRQRVNALALVHRWMYQDEAAQGVDLRALLADLTANLEHGFEARGGPVRVTATVERMFVNQDTALPVAFLVTELAASAARAAGAEGAAVTVDARVADGRGRLCVAAPAFAAPEGLGAFEDGSQRIVTGLARQLRGQLRHEPDQRRFVIDFAVLRTV